MSDVIDTPESDPQADAEEFSRHCRKVVKKLRKGIVVPLLGAGVNLVGRPAQLVWDPLDRRFLPSGPELASYLTDELEDPPELAGLTDLMRVSQFVDVTEGSGGLYRMLHDLFDADYPPGVVHTFLAEIAGQMRGLGTGMPVMLTTNYDDALERAFDAAGQPYDLITYVVSSPVEHRGRFMHVAPGEEPRVIENSNDYEVALDERTVILKLHGAVQRAGTFENDNYVITEDHYINYLTHADITSLLPFAVTERLRNSHFLFLGYGMSDWNLRVLLHRIWGEQPLSFISWAIQNQPDRMEQMVWRRRNVDILRVELYDYIKELRLAAEMPPAVAIAP